MTGNITHGNIMVGISSCLLGERVRYDGGHRLHSYITGTLGQYFTFRPFCPEMAIGLGAPRETLRLEERDGRIHCIGNQTASLDVTAELEATARQQAGWHRDLCGYIFKAGSPSCGMAGVKVYRNGEVTQEGAGIYARRLQQDFPHLPVEDEGRLGDPSLRINFLQRVFAYREWRDLEGSGITLHTLTGFHARYKYLLLSHHQQRTRDLGKRLALASAEPLDAVAGWYLAEWMGILSVPATTPGHVNVLQHLQGFLKKEIDAAARQELAETIEGYRLGRLPLIEPLMLLRHHFRHHPHPFVQNCRYLYPQQADLLLRES